MDSAGHGRSFDDLAFLTRIYFEHAEYLCEDKTKNIISILCA